MLFVGNGSCGFVGVLLAMEQNVVMCESNIYPTKAASAATSPSPTPAPFDSTTTHPLATMNATGEKSILPRRLITVVGLENSGTTSFSLRHSHRLREF